MSQPAVDERDGDFLEREAMRLAAQKLPVHTKFVMREEKPEKGGQQ